jgi:hypothetical protein
MGFYDFIEKTKKTFSGIKDSAKWIGERMPAAFNYGKNEMNKIFDKIKSIPVIGRIASAIEASPLGDYVRSGIQGVEDAVGAAGSLLQGNVKDALEQGAIAATNLL